MNNYKFLEMRVDKLGRKKMTQDELSSNIQIDRNRIQQLETSPKVVPKETELRAYCQFFNTTADYLLGISNANTKDEDIAMISKATGLSDTSIDRLKNYTQLQRDIVDKLLSTKAMDKVINAYIYRNSHFFQKIEIVDSICGRTALTDEENSNYHFFQSVEMLKDAINILSNDFELFMKLNHIHAEVKGEELWKIAIDLQVEQNGIDKTLDNLLKSKVVPKYAVDYAKSLKDKGSD